MSALEIPERGPEPPEFYAQADPRFRVHPDGQFAFTRADWLPRWFLMDGRADQVRHATTDELAGGGWQEAFLLTEAQVAGLTRQVVDMVKGHMVQALDPEGAQHG